MALKFTAEGIETIHRTLRQFPAGAATAEVAAVLPESPDARTLDKWLGEMVTFGRARREGDGVEARYFAIVAEDAVPASTPALPETDPEFDKMLQLSLPFLLTLKRSREQTRANLQHQAAQHEKTGAAMKAYIEYGLGRLDAFTLAEAQECGFTEEQYQAWSIAYHGGAAPAFPAPPPRDDDSAASTPLAPTAVRSLPISTAVAAAPALADPLDPGATRPLPRPPTPPGVGPAPSPFNAGGRAPDPSQEIGRALENLQLDRMFAWALAAAKQTVTWPRLAVCVAWALAVRGYLMHSLYLSLGVSVAMIVIAGAPWLYFRWRDRAGEQAHLEGRDIATALLAGGFVTMLFAKAVLSLLLALRVML